MMARKPSQKRPTKKAPTKRPKTSTGILPFKSDTACSNQYCLNLTFTEYATLLTQTGKAVRDDKAGFIDGEYQASLNQIALSSSQWLKASLEFE